MHPDRVQADHQYIGLAVRSYALRVQRQGARLPADFLLILRELFPALRRAPEHRELRRAGKRILERNALPGPGLYGEPVAAGAGLLLRRLVPSVGDAAQPRLLLTARTRERQPQPAQSVRIHGPVLRRGKAHIAAPAERIGFIGQRLYRR